MISLTDRLAELRLGDLATFLAVRHAGSISAASRELKVTPSQVSKAITRLEATLRLKLISRGGRNVSLTEMGLRVLPHVEAVVARLQLVGRANNDSARELTLAAPSYLLAAFVPVIEQFQSRLQVRGIEMPPPLLRAYSAEDFFDMCLCAGPIEGLPSTWVSVCIGPLRRALFAPPDLARRLGTQPVPVDKLRSIPFVCPVYYAEGHLVAADDDCPLPRTERIVGHQALAIGSALELASRTGQLVFGPVIAAQRHLAARALQEVHVQGWDVASQVYVACNGDRVLAHVQTAVVEGVRAALLAMDPG
jgi:DNA-binding transcriptional LysR family regulator